MRPDDSAWRWTARSGSGPPDRMAGPLISFLSGLGIAVNQASATDQLRLGLDTPVRIEPA